MRRANRSRTRIARAGARAGVGISLGLLCLGGASGAEEPPPEPMPKVSPAPAPKAPAPPVSAARTPLSLDRLFKLPESYSRKLEAPRDEVAGADRREWQDRFADARRALEQSENALRRAQTELGETASTGNAWQVAAPGQSTRNSENSPVSFKLRQEIRRHREEVETAERALQALRVEANLAGVPEDWR